MPLADGPFFTISAQAGSRQFINQGGAAANGYAGDLFFFGSSNAANATIVNHGSTVPGANEGGVVLFNDKSFAGTATITNEGSAFVGSGLVTAGGLATSGGQTQFFGSASADHATITNAAALSDWRRRRRHPLQRKQRNADHATITNAGCINLTTPTAASLRSSMAPSAGHATIQQPRPVSLLPPMPAAAA